jgi:hypothetical protein
MASKLRGGIVFNLKIQNNQIMILIEAANTVCFIGRRKITLPRHNTVFELVQQMGTASQIKVLL